MARGACATVDRRATEPPRSWTEVRPAASHRNDGTTRLRGRRRWVVRPRGAARGGDDFHWLSSEASYAAYPCDRPRDGRVTGRPAVRRRLSTAATCRRPRARIPAATRGALSARREHELRQQGLYGHLFAEGAGCAARVHRLCALSLERAMLDHAGGGSPMRWRPQQHDGGGRARRPCAALWSEDAQERAGVVRSSAAACRWIVGGSRDCGGRATGG